MVKLVLLSEGLTGRSHELIAEKTTIGRVDDNTFPIAESSVSSHHCEVLLRGSEVVIKDLNSTNGTFIEGNQISGEAVLKPGQVLRLGQVQMRLESGDTSASKKPVDQTMVMPRGAGGVKLNELEQGPRAVDTKVFSKKTNKVNTYFLIGGIILAVVIIGGLIYAFKQAK
ncbi:MAG TPA: FHA domain-containing protein [Dongiaceae bacterium]|jgi:pSer/pThr/pTyr-binding forkhead associated (FHA) protein|nr:FHA domain-containing protein [Dongiaceae bacterium]